MNTTLHELFKNNAIDLNDLFIDIVINGETFKPIDKFQNFNISKLIKEL